MSRVLSILLVTCLLNFGAETVLGQGTAVNLDPTTTYQTMTGWEAASWAYQYNDSGNFGLTPTYGVFSDALASGLANFAGINRIRLGVNCYAENTVDYWTLATTGQISWPVHNSHLTDIVNDNSDPNVINDAGFQWTRLDQTIEQVVLPLKKYVEQRGEHLVIDAQYVCTSNAAPSTVHTANPAEYAEFVLAVYKHMQAKYGFVPDLWGTVNEPDNTNTAWSVAPPGHVEGAIIKATGDVLKANGFPISFAAANTECPSDANTYFDNIIKTPGALQYISELSYHRYCGQPVNPQALKNIASRVSTNGIKSAMTECWSNAGCTNNYTTIYDDLVNGLASAWEYLTEAGTYSVTFSPSYPSNPTIAIAPAMKLLRQYMLFVRYGAKRIAASATSGTIFPVAFINPPGPTISGGQWTVVAYTTGATTFTVNGLPAGTYGIKYALASGAYDQDLTDQTIVAGGSVTTTIPDTGVITVYGKQNLTPTVLVAAPLAASSVSGVAIPVSATVADISPVIGVQFKLDGVNLGAEVTTPPFATIWDSTTIANGPHQLAAVARDLAGNQFTASAVTVNVNNAPPFIPYSVGVSGAGAWSLPNAGGLRVEYARVLPGVGSPVPSGMAIFGYSSGGVLVSEAGVPASPPIASGRIYAETGTSIKTGIALANPSSQDTVVSFYFTDVNGLNVGSGSFTLVANHQLTAFLDQSPFGGPPSIQGTFTFTASPSPVSAIALRGFTNQRNEFLLTTLQISSLNSGSFGAPLIFPHFVMGAGWMTEPVLINPTDSPLSGTIQFFAQNSTTGTTAPVNVQNSGLNSSMFPYTIPPRGQFNLVAQGLMISPDVGWIQVIPAAGTATPAGVALLSYVNSQGITASQTSILATPAGSAFQLFIEASGAAEQIGSIRSGLAMCNPSAIAVSAQLELRNVDGTPTGLTASVTIPPSGQIARFIDEFIPQIPTPFTGILRVTSLSPLYTAALRGRVNERGDFLISTTPPSNEANVSTASETDFADIVSGGGYSTELVVFPTVNGSTGAGTIVFVNSDGSTPLNQNRLPIP